MKEILEKNKCSGCSACMNICPKDAIKMMEDENGFKYPLIDNLKCVGCNLCKKTCPVLNKAENAKKDVLAYACYNKNINERLNSSSGGAFVLFAKEILKRKGVVFGAMFNEKFEVVHGYIQNKEDLDKLMRSKYTQSDIGNSYFKVKNFLDDDKYVLFTGTPCQIEGLLAYLNKKYDKLYTQDIICHGVPSPKAWIRYLEFQEKTNKDNIRKISFRNKDKSWKLFRMKINFDNKTYTKDTRKDIFLQAFLKNTILRDSCYNCTFKDKYRKSGELKEFILI